MTWVVLWVFVVVLCESTMRWLLGLFVLGVFLAGGAEAGHCAGGREVCLLCLIFILLFNHFVFFGFLGYANQTQFFCVFDFLSLSFNYPDTFPLLLFLFFLSISTIVLSSS